MFGIDDMIMGAVIGGGANFLGSALTNKTNKGIASSNRAFQVEMSNTAYQRAVQDLNAAGLSPLLAYSQGGASSPSGSSWSYENPISGSVNSAISAMRSSAELKILSEQLKGIKADNVGKSISNRLNATLLPDAEFKAEMDRSALGKVGKVIERVSSTLLPTALGASAAKGLWNFLKPTSFLQSQRNMFSEMHSNARSQMREFLKFGK